MKHIDCINEGGVNGLGISLLDQSSQELKELRNIIKRVSTDQTSEDRLNNLLISIRFQMETYLSQKEPAT